MEYMRQKCLYIKFIPMADIIVAQKNGKRRLTPPRIDLTPMVDLGFLLITFFMYTTTIAKPKVIDLNMPYKPAQEATTDFPASNSMTLIPTTGHQIAYYEGLLEHKEQMKSGNIAEARKAIIDKKRSIQENHMLKSNRMFVLIKPNNDCTYSDVVNVLDEMIINDVQTYAIVDITSEEQEMLKLRP